MRMIHLLAAAAALATFACGSSSSPTAPSNGPALNVMIKDSPFTDAKSLLVTFSTVSAHAAGGAFTALPFSGGASTRTCDLERLTSAQDVLGTGPLAAGHYTQLRLVVSAATIYFDNASDGSACATSIAAPVGRNASVEIPSGEVILNREFDVTSAGATAVLLDFDGDRSVQEAGNGRYVMSPVISVVSVN